MYGEREGRGEDEVRCMRLTQMNSHQTGRFPPAPHECTAHGVPTASICPQPCTLTSCTWEPRGNSTWLAMVSGVYSILHRSLQYTTQ